MKTSYKKEGVSVSVYIQKVLVKAARLEHTYQTNLTYDGFRALKHLPQEVTHRNFYKNFKFLYLYEKYKDENRFSEAFISLAKERYQIIETYILEKIQEMVSETLLNDESLMQFFNDRILPLYFNKYAIYPITSVSHMPLDLRLYVYYLLYQHETNDETKCHLLNRLSVTLSRMNKAELANMIALYNWCIAQSKSDYFAKTKSAQTALKAIVRHDKKYQTVDLQAHTHLKKPMAEIYLCYKKLIEDKKLKYDKDSVMCLDCMTICYKEYSELEKIAELFKVYIRTKDKAELSRELSKARMTLLKNSIHLPTNQTDYILPDYVRFQLQLYDRLIQMTI